LPDASSLGWRLAPDLLFDRIQLADPAQRFGRRGGRLAGCGANQQLN